MCVCVCAETVNLRLEYADVRGRNIMLDIILRYSCIFALWFSYTSEVTEAPSGWYYDRAKLA